MPPGFHFQGMQHGDPNDIFRSVFGHGGVDDIFRQFGGSNNGTIHVIRTTNGVCRSN